MIDDAKLATILSRESAKALDHWENGLRKEQEKALRYYVGHQYDGDDDAEMDTWSKVVSRDVAEVVDWSLPEIVKLFLEQDVIGQFEAKDPEDEQAAEQASEYIQHVLKLSTTTSKMGCCKRSALFGHIGTKAAKALFRCFAGLPPKLLRSWRPKTTLKSRASMSATMAY